MQGMLFCSVVFIDFLKDMGDGIGIAADLNRTSQLYSVIRSFGEIEIFKVLRRLSL